LFLDKELNIRRFTFAATKIFKLIKSDIGRPFTDQTSDLNYPELADDALEVLRTLVFIQKEIPARDGRWFLVRIMPYRTLDDRIDGLVITFINMSDHKRLEEKLLENEKMFHLLLSASSDTKVILSDDMKVVEFNPHAELFFGRRREDCIDKNFIQMFVPEELQISTEKNFKMLLSKGLNDKLKINVIASNGNILVVGCFVTISLNSLNKAEGMILSIKKLQNHE